MTLIFLTFSFTSKEPLRCSRLGREPQKHGCCQDMVSLSVWGLCLEGLEFSVANAGSVTNVCVTVGGMPFRALVVSSVGWSASSFWGRLTETL